MCVQHRCVLTFGTDYESTCCRYRHRSLSLVQRNLRGLLPRYSCIHEQELQLVLIMTQCAVKFGLVDRIETKIGLNKKSALQRARRAQTQQLQHTTHTHPCTYTRHTYAHTHTHIQIVSYMYTQNIKNKYSLADSIFGIYGGKYSKNRCYQLGEWRGEQMLGLNGALLLEKRINNHCN